MYDDDQITRDLGDAFRTATASLTYNGRVPAPRRVSATAVASGVVGAVGVAGMAVVVVGAATSSGPAVKTPPATAQAGEPTAPVGTASTQSGPSGAATAPVTETLTLAGYTFTYTQAPGGDRLVGKFVTAVPDGAKRVETSGPAKDWIGVDPTTGYATAYVVPASGQILAISAPDATSDELTALLQSAEPQAIPVVEPTTS